MIQSFRLSDSGKKSFLTVLRVIIETTFPTESTKWSQLYLTTQKDVMVRDGKKWIGSDRNLLEKLGVESLGASDKRGWSKPDLLFVCTIANYRSDMKSNNGIPFNNYDKLMEKINSLLEEDPNKKISRFDDLKKECGSGYNYAFNQYDGDIGLGYFAEYRPNGAWHNIDISFCHIYYGK